MIAVVAAIAAGCETIEKDKTEEDNKNSEQQNDDNGKKDDDQNGNKTVLSPQEQKEKLEEVGIELIGYADLKYWGDAFVSFVNFVGVINNRDYDNSAFEEMAEAIEGGNDSDYVNTYVNYGWWCNYEKPVTIETDRSSCIHLSEAKGAFTLDEANARWDRAESSDLSISANAEGQAMTLSAKIQDEDTKSLISEYFYENGRRWPEYKTGPAQYVNEVYDAQYDYTYEKPEDRINGEGITEYHIYNPVTGQDMGWITNEQYYSDYMEAVTVPAGERIERVLHNAYAYIPRSLDATFVADGDKLADIKATLDYTGKTAGVVDLENDLFGVKADFTAAGYNLNITKADVLKESASAGYVLSCGNTPLMTVNVSERGFSVARNDIIDKNSEKSESGKEYWYEGKSTSYKINTTPEYAELDIDILGKIQIKGTANVTEMMEISAKMDEDRTNAVQFALDVKEAENSFSLDVFYDGSSERSAYLGLEPMPGYVYSEEGAEVEGWEVIPVIRFADGSSYALPEVFFSQADFADLINAIAAYQQSVEEFLENTLNRQESEPIYN